MNQIKDAKKLQPQQNQAPTNNQVGTPSSSSLNNKNLGKPNKPRVKKNWIPVAAGILKMDHRVLLGQRPENHTLAGLWEFPGGKIELGETPEEALARELNEELGIDAEIGDLKIACTHSYGDVGIIILFFEVLFWKGEPKTKHHMNLEWVTASELIQKNIPDANRKNLTRIFKAFNMKADK